MGRSVRVFAIVCGGITAVVVGALLAVDLRKDRWEARQGIHLDETLAQGAALENTDALKAFSIYDAIVQEASKHKIRLSSTREYVEEAKRRRDALAARLEEAKAERVAAIEKKRQEKERQASEQRERQERAKLAQERSERIKKEAAKYRNASPQAKAALNALKRIEARTEVGVTNVKYGEVVGEQYAEIKIFIESPEAQMMPLFSARIMAAIAQYKSAMEIWQLKIKYSPTQNKYPPTRKQRELDIRLQEAWSEASKATKRAEEVLLNPEQELELTEK